MICRACGRPKCIDSFAGEGGMGAGLMRAGFCCDAVDNDGARLARYPSDCPAAKRILGDALAYLLWHGHEYALRHNSPTCTGYSRGTAALPDRLEKYDRLIGATRAVLLEVGGPYIIENVEDAKPELVNPVMLCWTHFYTPGSVVDDDGTPLWMKRHRLFESNLDLWPAADCAHPANMQCAGAYGGARRDKWEAKHVRKGGYVPSTRVMGELLGIDWMTQRGLKHSIPPVYAEHIGRQALAQIEQVAA